MYINIHSHLPAGPDEWAIQNLYTNWLKTEEQGRYSIGLHPWYITASNFETELRTLQRQSVHPNVLAIGECGLDKVTATDWQLQQQAFTRQIELANEVRKPLIIHCVRAYEEVLQLLSGARVSVPVIFHGFNKNVQLAQQIAGKGYYLSFGEALGKAAVGKTFASLSPESVLLETDDSKLSIKEIYRMAAAARGISEDALSLQLQKNYTTIFGTVS